jgi:mRNA-degrading endonuclease RelE of RelBE toxin-antitoxin system
MFKIEYSEGIAEDLAGLRSFDRNQILDRIEEQLTHQPVQETRNKKLLVGLIPPWDHVPPIWEQRIGEHRVFYDVDQEASCVFVRAIRHKPPHKTTEEIL